MILPTMTEARAAWLEQLSEGPSNRPRGPVGFQVMRLGWSEWNYCDRETGQPISEAEAKLKHGDRWWDHCRAKGERLTSLGWAALREHRQRMAKLGS